MGIVIVYKKNFVVVRLNFGGTFNVSSHIIKYTSLSGLKIDGTLGN